MKKTVLFSAIILIFAFTSCEKTPVEPSSVSRRLSDSTILVALHETFTDTDFSLRYDSLLEDSRCPEGVMCCWEGNAKVQLTLRQSGENHTFTLNTAGGMLFPQDTVINNIKYELTNVSPYPKHSEKGIIYDGTFTVEIEITPVKQIDFEYFSPACCEWVGGIRYSVVKIDSYSDYNKYTGNHNPLCYPVPIDFKNKTVLLACGETQLNIENISTKLIQEKNRYYLEVNFTPRNFWAVQNWTVSIITD